MLGVHPLLFSKFVEWTRNGGQHSRDSSTQSVPLRPIHGRRCASWTEPCSQT